MDRWFGPPLNGASVTGHRDGFSRGQTQLRAEGNDGDGGNANTRINQTGWRSISAVSTKALGDEATILLYFTCSHRM